MGIVDTMAKSAHIIPINISFPLTKLVEIYIRVIMKLHGVLLSIVSDIGPIITFGFQKSLLDALGTNLKLNFADHP